MGVAGVGKDKAQQIANDVEFAHQMNQAGMYTPEILKKEIERALELNVSVINFAKYSAPSCPSLPLTYSSASAFSYPLLAARSKLFLQKSANSRT